MTEYLFGIDVGGTTCKMGLFETDGTLLEKWEIKTETSDGGKAILPSLAASVDAKILERGISRDQVLGVGLGVPGPVTADGVIHGAVNLGWGDMAIADELSSLLGGITVKAGNDANVAALGESWMGAGKDYDDIVMVTLGTGIGGGIIINNQIIPGAHGAAGEIGHICANPHETEACGCGLHGCIEQYASATGFARMARRELTESTMPSSLREIPIDDITAKDVFDGAKAGDSLCQAVVEHVCDMLSTTIASICAVVNPEAVLIGGGVSKAGHILIEAIEGPFRQKAFKALRGTEIRLATLGNDAGIYGAARLVM